MDIIRATAQDHQALAELLFSSGPDNLISLLTGHHSHLNVAEKKQICLDFLKTALQLPDGQFGFENQHVLLQNGELCGCISYWKAPIPEYFKQQTLASLVVHFGALETAAILNNSEALSQLVQSPSESDLCIGHLAVSPLHRRQGIAHRLLTYCELQAKNLGKTRLILDVMEDNQAAQKTYIKFGFQPCFLSRPSEEGVKVGFLPHIHMQKNLV
ncbi:GNAT family N-acetyltransferase [Aliiglaciecola lipolytica]|uniref:N-acetyltransferase domain-containing protein n=1 Tax=Aliiglaciecola lipolytica E3 TaxID=1127673 RepID=K6YI96_9ALTE|nr:GNAT family N-acetyltransferase [Aliiglaciecola lipolytica]GAC16303.1 hypothetical protein GLIP_3692 [Aliiglaciecola lipolytica E3]